MSKPQVLVTIVFAGALTACSANIESSDSSGTGLTGSGKMQTEARKLETYHAIQLDLPADLSVTVGTEGDAQIETDDNILPHITTKVSDGKLRIASDTSLNNMHNLKIGLKTSKLDELAVNGAGKVSLDGMSGGKLKISSNGASTITASGKLDLLDAELNGAGSISAANLSAKDAKVNMNGAGTAEVNASDNLDASITGAGNIKYKGDPKLNQRITGIGNIQKM
jgi:hypothetical protein